MCMGTVVYVYGYEGGPCVQQIVIQLKLDVSIIKEDDLRRL